MVSVDAAADCGQLLRTLAELRPAVPAWRRQRPCLLAEAAHFFPAEEGDLGVLTVRCMICLRSGHHWACLASTHVRCAS